MVIEYMYNNELSTIIKVNYRTEKIQVENYTDDLIKRAFGINEKPTFSDFESFLEERCFPRTRDKMKFILNELGLDCYDPIEIVKKTQGRMAEDNMWLVIKEDQVEEMMDEYAIDLSDKQEFDEQDGELFELKNDGTLEQMKEENVK